MKTILLVEDNADDVFITKLACQRSGFPHLFFSVPNGETAKEYLAGTGQYADRSSYPFPHLIFLDVKLPKLSGHQLLEWIRSQPNLNQLPVIMLTGSLEKSDVDRAYKLGVTSYVNKQANIVEFGQGIRVILKYWFELTIWPR